MKLVCPKCQSVYRIPDERLPSQAAQAQCKKCGATMRIPAAPIENAASPPAGPNNRPRRVRRPPALPPVISMSSRQPAPRDTLGIVVFVVAVLILLTATVWVIRDIHRFFSGSGTVLSRMIESISAFDATTRKTGAGAESGSLPAVQKRLEAGHRYFRSRRYKDALQQYQAAVDLDSKNEASYFWRGRAYLKTGRYDPAVEDFKQVLVLNPDHRRAYDNLGWLYMKKQAYDQSLAYLNKSLQLEPENGWTYYTRGHVFFKAGKTKLALADARKACLLGYRPGCRLYEKRKDGS